LKIVATQPLAHANPGRGFGACVARGEKKSLHRAQAQANTIKFKFYVYLSRTSLRTGLGLKKVIFTVIQKATEINTVRLIAHYLAFPLAINPFDGLPVLRLYF